MNLPLSSISSPQSSLNTYILALALFAVALAVRWIILADTGMAFVTFYPAVIITAWLCGFGPAVLVIGLSMLAGQYLFSSPMMSIMPAPGDIPALAIFGISGLFLGYMIDHIRHTLQNIGNNNDKLQETTQKLEQDILQREQAEAALRESEIRFRTLFDLTSIGVILCIAADGRFARVNRKFCEIIGYSQAELLGMTCTDVMHPKDRPLAEARTDALRAGEVTEYNLQQRMIRKDGATIWVDITCTALWSRGHQPTHYLAVVQDITDKRMADEVLFSAMEKLAESEVENRLILNSVDDGIYGLDLDGHVTFANPAAAGMLGYEMAELHGKPLQSLLPSSLPDGSVLDYAASPVAQALKTGLSYQAAEAIFRRKDGTGLLVEYNCTPIRKRDNFTGVVVTFRDISQRKKTEEQMFKLAHYDSVTGLPNRALFLDRLEHEIKKSQRTNKPLALMFIDLDHFKEINDTLGHDIGDLLLKEAAGRLRRCVRESDTVARMGGDEFTVIVEKLDEPGIVDRIAQNILRQVAEPFRINEEIAYVTASIGITMYPQDSARLEELLKNADQAMYAAKRQCRNCYRYFTPSMQEAAQARVHMANDLRVAIASKQFRVFYQPIVDMENGAIVKAEALIRWQHPERGRINPSEFIPIAEDTGLIVDIGNWVFREVAQQIAVWRETYQAPLQISINKSPAQFQSDSHSSSAWPAYLEELGLPGQSIVVEITEGVLLNASNVIREQLRLFRQAGMQVSLDDFGMGYSSLSYLQKFDIDNLKIDQTFIRNLSRSPDDMALCRAIIVMAHTLGMKVTAEGVETQEQCDLLTEAGCDFGQGFLFSKPLPAHEFEVLL